MRRLMNSRAPISGFESPASANRAIWAASCGVSRRAFYTALANSLARDQQLAAGAVGERFRPHRSEHVDVDAPRRPHSAVTIKPVLRRHFRDAIPGVCCGVLGHRVACLVGSPSNV